MNKYDIEKLLTEVGNVEDNHFCAYLIGGGALTWNLLQNDTKDLDFVVERKEDLVSFITCLKKIGFDVFLESDTDQSNVSYSKPIALIRDNQLIDIFYSRTTHYVLSKSMITRSNEIFSWHNNKISVLSPDDIFLLKTATGRPSDSKILNLLARTNSLDWGDLLNEMEMQINLGNLRATSNMFFALTESALLNDSIVPKDFLMNLISLNNKVMKQTENVLRGKTDAYYSL